VKNTNNGRWHGVLYTMPFLYLWLLVKVPAGIAFDFYFYFYGPMPEISIVVLYLAIGWFPFKPLTTFLHELGHAIPALLFTKQEVKIFIGSYGNTRKGFNLKAGRLLLWVNYNPLRWYKGMCKFEANETSINQRIIILLMGPVITFIIGLFATILVFSDNDIHGAMRFMALGLLISSGVELYVNLIPNFNQVRLDNGLFVSNDGGQIAILIGLKRIPPNYRASLEYYYKADYKTTLEILEPAIDDLKGRILLYVVIHSFVQENQYAKALPLYRKLEKLYTPNSNELLLLSIIQWGMDDKNDAIKTIGLLLSKEPLHVMALNNIGYYLICMEQYSLAITYLEKALKLSPEFSFAANNLGLARIKTGKKEEGLQLINFSLSLDDTNPWAVRNKGIYYLETGDKREALSFFEEAKRLQTDVPDIDDLILKACLTG
jgi:tetratricopeptide (TPR) repeat protein